jgi:hypothetical protein
MKSMQREPSVPGTFQTTRARADLTPTPLPDPLLTPLGGVHPPTPVTGDADRDHPNCRRPCDRICLNQKQHRLFLQRFGEDPAAEATLDRFYAETRAQIPPGPFGDNAWKFWERHFEQRFGQIAKTATVGVSRKTSGNVAALQQFVARHQEES